MTQALPSSDLNSAEASVGNLDLSKSRAARKQHDQMVSWAKSQFRAIRNARTGTERQWYLNLAFYFGKQNVHVLRPQTNGLGNTVSTRLFVPPAPYYRARPVINRIRPTIRHEIAQLTNNKPNASIVPASAEDRDMYAAMAGEQIWENLYTEKKLKHIIRRAVWWNQVCGNGFIKSWWDFSKGPNDPKTGKPQGDVCYSPETPFHVLCPDFKEEEIENQPFMIHAQAKSPAWVKMNFKQALDGSQLNTGQADATDLIEESFMNLVGTQTLNKSQSVLVLEVWVKPGQHPMFPEGSMFTVIGDKIVQGFTGWPYSHGMYPMAKFDHIMGGKFYAASSVEDLIPLQKEYNRTRGQIIEAKNRMAKPQLTAPRGSVDPSKITSEPGQVILYTPGFEAPRPIPLEPLPSYVIQEQDRMLMDWNDISGQHDVSKGQAPPGVTAATAISYLQERDESKMSPTFDSLEEGIEKTARMSLVYVHDYWDIERLVRITGVNGSFDVMTFKGSDLGGNLDIRIEAGSSLPVSKAAKQAFIMDLMKMGFIDPQKGLEVMDMGGINKIYEVIQVDQRQAQRENLRMSKATPDVLMQHEASFAPPVDPMADISQLGNPDDPNTMDPGMQQDPSALGMGLDPAASAPPDPNAPADPNAPVDPNAPLTQPVPQPPAPLLVPVNTWDNHKMHIEYHNQFRKGQSFENLPEQTKALFEQHVQQHIQAMGIESVTQNPQAAAGLPPMPGQPPGQDGGNPPPDLKGGPPPGPGGQAGQAMPGQGQPGPNPMPQLQMGGQ